MAHGVAHSLKGVKSGSQWCLEWFASRHLLPWAYYHGICREGLGRNSDKAIVCSHQFRGAPYPASSLANTLICRSLIFSAGLLSQDPDTKPGGVLQAESFSVLAEERLVCRQNLCLASLPGWISVAGKGPCCRRRRRGAGWAKGVNSCVLHGEDPQNSKAHMHCRPWPRMFRVAL